MKEKNYKLKKVSNEKENHYECSEGCAWSSIEEYLWIGVLGGCGCGSSEYFGKIVFKLLIDFNRSHLKRRIDIYDDKNLEIEVIAHWMDDKGLIEHGSSIGGSWLTEVGEKLLESIKKLDKTKKQ